LVDASPTTRQSSDHLGLLLLAATHRAEAAGDPDAGAQVFRTCAACHTLEPGLHRTGPSLANVFGRKAGAAEGFHRYSDAPKSADLVWREDTLSTFLANPQTFLPGNRMTFPGITDAQARADGIAYLETATPGERRARLGSPAQSWPIASAYCRTSSSVGAKPSSAGSGLADAHRRLRRLTKAPLLEIQAHEPPDIMGCFVVVPIGRAG
jgi:cytochrome c2